MKMSWIITRIIKVGWTHITLNTLSCKTAKGFALHSFHLSVLRGSATETGNPTYYNTHAAPTPSW